MFNAPFSFNGRIRRSEFGISFILLFVIISLLNAIITESDGDALALAIFYIPLYWFLWAQGSKRCHDIGNSGWFQLIPFYMLWMMFQDGEVGDNKYGPNPKALPSGNVQSTPKQSSSGYQGGYSGGHNSSSQSANFGDNLNNPSNEGYKNGDLYN
jgi:uncharacterized membrane protein YhaH (DUF805 family)